MQARGISNGVTSSTNPLEKEISQDRRCKCNSTVAGQRIRYLEDNEYLRTTRTETGSRQTQGTYAHTTDWKRLRYNLRVNGNSGIHFLLQEKFTKSNKTRICNIALGERLGSPDARKISLSGCSYSLHLYRSCFARLAAVVLCGITGQLVTALKAPKGHTHE